MSVTALNRDFIGVTLKVQPPREQVDELHFIEIKNFCSLSVTVNMKIQATDWEEILADHIYDEVSESGIYK